MPATINEGSAGNESSAGGGRSWWEIPARWNPAARAFFFSLCLVPFFALSNAVISDSLGPDPAEHLMHVTGEWVMRFMVLVLAATPLARWGWPRLARYRRMLGLYAWFYATLHLLVFAQVYIGWNGEILLEELAERPYVLVGFLAWLILVPLGITSADSIRRKMGRNWRKLHKLTYAVAILGWLHLLWLSRSDVGEAVVYGVVFVFLFVLRIRGKGFLSRAV
ncbi:putative membrane protein [gamma proteobacterium HIMB55]|nr:putative membrane protein [gamma proteobacterium HIMB55]